MSGLKNGFLYFKNFSIGIFLTKIYSSGYEDPPPPSPNARLFDPNCDGGSKSGDSRKSSKSTAKKPAPQSSSATTVLSVDFDALLPSIGEMGPYQARFGHSLKS